jgi:hypothetical protein
VFWPKVVLLASCAGLLAGCSESSEPDKHPAKKNLTEVMKPKKIKSKPCSKYNLKFYEGDVREFAEGIIRLGDDKSDARVKVGENEIAILGFEGQAEEYINYSIYRGNRYTEREEAAGSMLRTRTETQIIVCFKKSAIAVTQLVEKVRSRGELSKTQYFEKQWLWKLPED